MMAKAIKIKYSCIIKYILSSNTNTLFKTCSVHVCKMLPICNGSFFLLNFLKRMKSYIYTLQINLVMINANTINKNMPVMGR